MRSSRILKWQGIPYLPVGKPLISGYPESAAQSCFRSRPGIATWDGERDHTGVTSGVTNRPGQQPVQAQRVFDFEGV
jgi:hypothetical protein